MKNFKLEEFTQIFKQVVKTGLEIKLISTNYTKRLIIKDNQTYMFAEEVLRPETLKLINMIRNDAEALRETDFEAPKIQSYEVDFYKFVDSPDGVNEINGIKIDINEAYWKTGKNIGLISEETENYLKEIESKLDEDGEFLFTKKEIKNMKLRSLGSLATIKEERFFKNKEEYTPEYDDWNQRLQDHEKAIRAKNRFLYLYICETLSNVMSEIVQEFHEYIVYYYWDCLFLKKAIKKEEIFKRIEKAGYKCKIEGVGKFKINKNILNGGNIIFTNEKGKSKQYAINKEDVIY